MIELSIRLDAGGKHLYEQIYEYLRNAIVRGEIPKGERLPSSRMLADNLGVSRSTVVLAYDQLLSEGYIESHRGSGNFVCGLENASPFFQGKRAPLAGSNSAGHEHLNNGNEDQGGAGKEGSERGAVIDFSLRAIDMSCFPYATWRKLQRGVLADDRGELFELGEPEGDKELREEIAKYLHFSRGVSCGPEQIIVGAGNEYLLMLLRYILGEGRRIGMENPTYGKACRIFQSMNYTVCPIAMDEQGMRVDALEESGADIAYVMPAHQFPTGTVMQFTRRMELLRWAYSQRYVIEDDYDSEFRFRGRPIPALQASDAAGRVIYMGTFSKSIAPAIRISYMVLPDELLARYRERCRYLNSTVSRIDQSILARFLHEGYFERHLNRMRSRYRERHDQLLHELEPLRERFTIRGEDAGLYLLLEEKADAPVSALREKELAAEAAASSVIVYPMHELMMPDVPLPPGQILRPTLLLGFAALSEEEIHTGAVRLTEALHK